jgi:hypothetical protein
MWPWRSTSDEFPRSPSGTARGRRFASRGVPQRAASPAAPPLVRPVSCRPRRRPEGPPPPQRGHPRDGQGRRGQWRWTTPDVRWAGRGWWSAGYTARRREESVALPVDDERRSGEGAQDGMPTVARGKKKSPGVRADWWAIGSMGDGAKDLGRGNLPWYTGGTRARRPVAHYFCPVVCKISARAGSRSTPPRGRRRGDARRVRPGTGRGRSGGAVPLPAGCAGRCADAAAPDWRTPRSSYARVAGAPRSR